MLLLTAFTVENFRGIRQGTVSGLTDVNVIIGRNNSGKTTLLEAMHRTLSENQKNLLGVKSHGYWSLVRNEAEHGFVSGTLVPSTKSSFISSRTVQQREVLFNLSRGTDNFNDWGQWELSTQPGIIVAAPDREGVFGEIAGFGRMTICYRPLDAVNTAIESNLWSRLLTDRSDKKLAAALNDVFGLQAESFQLLPSGKLIVLFENHSVPLDAQGDGTRAAMRCLMLLTALKQTMFILEEPECHQHPGSLERFALAVCKLAKQNEVQLMISTHSGECVRAFLKAAETAKSDSALFHLSLTDGIQTARRLDPDAVETLQNTGIDVRFLDLYS